MEVVFRQLNPGHCRTYLAGDANSGQVVLVDPVLDYLELYLAELKGNCYTLCYVIDTHTHADHITCGPVLKDLTDCQYVMHENSHCPCVDLRVQDGSLLTVGDLSITVLHTPGHARDAICLLLPGILMTGDTLLLAADGAGRDDLQGGNRDHHWDSLQKLLSLSPELIIYPAHVLAGGEPLSLAMQKIKNQHLQLDTRQEYGQYVATLGREPMVWTSDILQMVDQICAQDMQLAWMPVDLPAYALPAGGGKGVNDQEIAVILPVELKKRLEAGDRPVLLDVREAAELNGALGHLPGIIHIPVGQMWQRIGELEAWRETELVVVCRSGARAYTAAQILQQAGFGHVAVLEGGMLAWFFINHPIDNA